MNNDESFFGTFFGTPVVCTQVKENTDILQSCYKDIGDGKWGRIYEHSNQNKNMGWGYDGKGDMRILESYPQIKKILLDNFTSFMNEIMMINSTKFDISTSWLTRIGKGEQSPMHLHANSFWSGVYYYDEDYDGTSPLTIESPLINHIKDFGFFVQPDEANEYNSLTMDLYPKKINYYYSLVI